MRNEQFVEAVTHLTDMHRKARQMDEAKQAGSIASGSTLGMERSAMQVPRGGQYFITRFVGNTVHEWGPFTAEAALQTISERGGGYNLICRHGRETPVE